MKFHPRWSRSTLIFGGTAFWGLLLISCVAVGRTTLAPPKISGATFVGTKECAQCHDDKTSHFSTATHARLALSDPKVGETGCEACHGPGSIHVKSGGAAGTIINPRKSPETCFQCHADKRASFSLPNSHPVMAGKVSCADCHNPHEGNAIKGTGTALESEIDTCTKCHLAQKGPFVFEHSALKEGCTLCHNPHGTVNPKMLVARDQNLCLRCHMMSIGGTGANLGQIGTGAIDHTSDIHNADFMRGTCWSAGCHEAIHGSNANNHLRY